MNILGLNAYHADAAGALVVDGKLIAAAEEERFTRIKHWAGFPLEAIRYCLAAGNLTLSDIDIIAINSDSNAHRLRKLCYVIGQRRSPGLILQKLKNRKARADITPLLNDLPGLFNGKLITVEHHLAHLSSAFHVAPFDNAVVVSVDGFGDFASSAWGAGQGTTIKLDGQVFFPHSLGIFYQALTQYLGFKHYGDEYKVMGLAPYGKPGYLPQMEEIVKLVKNGEYRLNLDYFRHANEKVEYSWHNCAPEFSDLYSERLVTLLGPARHTDGELTQKHKDIAASVQAMYEQAFFHLLNYLHNQYGMENLALAGGCAMNSVANGKVYANTPYRKVYIQAAAGDAGGAVGAAFSTWFKEHPEKNKNHVMAHAYWGPAFNNEQVDEVLQAHKSKLEESRVDIEFVKNENDLCQKVARLIAGGKVTGWFQGSMEWGPRALGHRSILCNPARADMKDILNSKIKRRESFRPFAPSILRETVNDWFEVDDDVPFMMKVFTIREEKRSKIPAVTHVDGSGRLQTVTENDNGIYCRLIKSFYDQTGIPLVLNTSFNENEPIVCTPVEALDCFLRTNMDVLVMGNYLVTR